MRRGVIVSRGDGVRVRGLLWVRVLGQCWFEYEEVVLTQRVREGVHGFVR